MPEIKEDPENTSPEELFRELDAVENEVRALQSDLTSRSQQAGFALEAIRSARDNYGTIVANLGHFEELRPMIASGIYQAQAIKSEVQNIRHNLAAPLDNVRGVALSVYTHSSTAGSVAMSLSPEDTSILEFPAFMQSDRNIVAQRLSVVDPSLSDTYLEIDQTYYGTSADNLRAALAMTRQAFDHLFDKLAPNDDVRKSKFWKRKSDENNEDLVTRRERILYAIDRHVKDPYRANTLHKSIDNILHAYQGLNSLHGRGKVNAGSARQSLFTIKHFLEDFADALE